MFCHNSVSCRPMVIISCTCHDSMTVETWANVRNDHFIRMWERKTKFLSNWNCDGKMISEMDLRFLHDFWYLAVSNAAREMYYLFWNRLTIHQGVLYWDVCEPVEIKWFAMTGYKYSSSIRNELLMNRRRPNLTSAPGRGNCPYAH